jgi:hypothetical protein
MLPPDVENWPEDAPPIVVVHTFQDARGRERILARTGGAFSWKSVQPTRRDDE